MSVPNSYLPRAYAWDVDWIDTHGSARVCGFLIPQADIHDRVQAGDRTGTGRLSTRAKERIAEELTVSLRRIAAIAFGPHQAPEPIAIRDCDG